MREILKKIKREAAQNVFNLVGWQTNRKMLVIESDDWGSIRMPSKEVYNKLLNSGIRVDKCSYNSNDSLESEVDLSLLFDEVSKFKDKDGKPLVITANYIVANPDFKRIESDEFQNYSYEPFTETYKKYPLCKNSLQILKQGIESKIFHPQFHGREHLNVNRWMKALRANLEETKFAFDNGVFGLSTNITKEKRGSYLAALDIDELSDIEDQKVILQEGLDLFENIFSYRSNSFIAANSVWNPAIEYSLKQNGIKTIQVNRLQLVPQIGNGNYRKKYHFIGQKNINNQIFLVRNVSFEPSNNPSLDWVSSAFHEIECAFRWNKPAIIGSHRVNFIGSINPENRKRNLILLNELITKIIKKWPEIEFMTSDQLANIIVA